MTDQTHPAVATDDSTTNGSATDEMATAYDPHATEQALYRWWEESGAFRPSGEGEPFTIIMPPPNLTGELHVGHALTTTVEDILIRWHRMRGFDTLWQPGVDHAAIAVNTLVERELRAEGIDPRGLGREAFLERVWTFVNRSRGRIAEQHRYLGASADWSREAFTMDPGPQHAVRTTFKRLYDDGLIYRGEYLVNWDPIAQTAISDLEVEHRETNGHFWHVRYDVLNANGSPGDDSIVIATTRPETIPADTAIAVHPEDERWRHLVGRTAVVPTVDRPVPIIADEAVSTEGGTGALKVTPGHDPVDFEIGQRHDLPIVNLMGPDGHLTEAGGPYAGLERTEARTRIVADLDAQGRLVRVEDYAHSVGHSQRSGAVVEPLISEQWFVRTQTLADEAIRVVREGEIRFVPERFSRTYYHWMEHIRDWTISRQIWWGHRIPVWYCQSCEAEIVAVEDPTACACGSADLRQDPDTLDTWFSSGLWPHSALGWPAERERVERYYPTQVMETGYDIIFFWVARMVMLCLYNSRKDQEEAGATDPRPAPPFHTVYLHGLVRAEDGQKMSKSRGNVVDPLRSIEQYGTDALRYALVSSTSPGNDQRITDQRLEAGRNFANKLWNASRFVIGLIEPGDRFDRPDPATLSAVEDRWICSRVEALTEQTHDLLTRYELGEANRQLRDFFWDEFADWYIEFAKVRVREGDRTAIPVLAWVLDRILRLLHPCMPFVTEAVWARLRQATGQLAPGDALITAAYPEPEAGARAFADAEAERTIAALQDFVRAIRNVRAERQVDAGRWVEGYIVGAEATAAARDRLAVLEVLARARPLHIVDHPEETPSAGVVTAVLPTGRVVLPMAGLFDMEAERTRLRKQIADVEAELRQVEGKLANEQFRSRAPAEVVGREEQRRDTARTRLAGLTESLAELDETGAS